MTLNTNPVPISKRYDDLSNIQGEKLWLTFEPRWVLTKVTRATAMTGRMMTKTRVLVLSALPSKETHTLEGVLYT